MFIELKSFLSNAAPHLLDVLTEAFKTFDKFELPNYQDPYIELLMLEDISTDTSIVDEVVITTIRFQEFLLKLYGVELEESVDITIKTTILNAILDIQNYSDTELLLKTLSLPVSTNEIFAELVVLVTHLDTSELLLVIKEVGHSFIEALKDHCVEAPEIITDADRELNQKYIDSFNKFNKLIIDDGLLIKKLLHEGISVGYPFNVYISIIGKELESMTIPAAANELIASALISSDGIGNPMGVIQDSLDTYFSSIDHITKISIAVTDLLLKIQRS